MKNLPVVYRSQNNAWMNTSIFSSWFHDDFVPLVHTKLQSLGQETKSLVFFDNCSAHLDEKLLEESKDGAATATFLPPNVTLLL